MSLDEPAPAYVDVCWDMGGVDILNTDGKSVVTDGHKNAGSTRFVVTNQEWRKAPTGGWRVSSGSDLEKEELEWQEMFDAGYELLVEVVRGGMFSDYSTMSTQIHTSTGHPLLDLVQPRDLGLVAAFWLKFRDGQTPTLLTLATCTRRQ